MRILILAFLILTAGEVAMPPLPVTLDTEEVRYGS